MSITTFQVKDKIIRAERHSTIENDDEVHIYNIRKIPIVIKEK